MEFELFKNILLGGGGITAGIYLLHWRANRLEKSIEQTADRVEKFHKEGMVTMEKVVDKVGELVTQVAIHNQRFSHGEERMDRIEDRLKIIGERAHRISNDLLKLEAKIERISKDD